MTIYQTLKQKLTDRYELSKLSNLYVFQMSEPDRLYIRKELVNFFQTEGLEGIELQEAIELGMDSKLSDLPI